MPRIVKKPFERKAEIIKATRHLIQIKEYEKMTLQDIMDQLGIAKGTIYHYFKSKEELLEAVVENIVNEHLEKMQSLIKEKKGTALQKMKMLLEKSHGFAAPFVLQQLHKKGNEAMHIRLLATALIKQAPIYATLIQQGCKEGVFQTDTPLECSEFILSAVQFLTDVGIYPWTKEDLTRRIDAFPRLIEQQLRAPKGSFRFLSTLVS
jgi:AcrR family transcriptional regulator